MIALVFLERTASIEVGRDVLGVAIYLGEYRDSTCVDDARHRREEGSRRNDDFVAGADSQHRQRQVECQRAVGERDRVACPE